MSESEEELRLKKKHGLGDHVRVSVSGSRPTRVRPPVSQGQANEPKGFGDLIARWTEKVGIKPCKGCHRRKAALNRVFPFRPK